MSDSQAHADGAVPGGLRLRLGGRFGVDADAVARAEAALASLSSNFETWMADEIVRLDAAWAGVQAQGPNAQTLEGLYMRAHDLKGLGATYQYPLVTRLAASLCQILHEPARRLAAPMALVEAHVAAIKQAVAQKIRSDDDPWAAQTATDLEARTAAALGG